MFYRYSKFPYINIFLIFSILCVMHITCEDGYLLGSEEGGTKLLATAMRISNFTYKLWGHAVL
jgi:hypothetical protein